MSSRLQLRRGTKTEHESFTGQMGETTVDTTNDDLRVHDGSTVGGKSAAQGNKYDGIKQLDNAPLKDRAQYDVSGFYTGTEVGGGQFIYDASRPKADHNGGTVITPEAIAAWDGTQSGLSVLLEWTGTGTGAFVMLEGSVIFDVTVKIPSAYPDLPSAIEAHDKIYTSGEAEKIILMIEAGHQLTKGLKVVQKDYSRFSIQSADSTVFLSPSFEAVFGGFKNNDIKDGDLFCCSYGDFPRIECLFDMQNNHATGLSLGASRAFVEAGCGVKNAGYRGLCVWSNSSAQARSSIFSGANGEGCRVQLGSTACLNSANFDNCLKEIVDYVDNFGQSPRLGAVYVSRSSICAARGATAKNSGGTGFHCRRGILNCGDADASNSGQLSTYGAGFLAESMGIIEAIGSVALNTKSPSAEASEGGRVHAGSTQLSTRTSSKCIRIFAGGEVITNEGTSVQGSVLPSVPSQILAESNADGLNSVGRLGTLFFTGANGAIRKVTPTGWRSGTRFGDGTFVLVSEQFDYAETIASGAFSGQIDLLSLITLPSWIDSATANVDSIEIMALGKASAAGGSDIAVSVFSRPGRIDWPVRIRNEGQSLNGVSSGNPIEAVQLQLVIRGTYNIDAVFDDS